MPALNLFLYIPIGWFKIKPLLTFQYNHIKTRHFFIKFEFEKITI